VRPAESVEQQAFQAMSAFYCSRKRWPLEWSEFAAEQSKVPGSSAWLHHFVRAKIEVSRAIVATVRYYDEAGGQKQVHFIAPPECGSSRSPQEISIAAGRVGFRLPAGFSSLGGREIKERWKNPPYPDTAWEDPVSGVVLAVRFGETAVEPSGLSELKPVLDEAYASSIPGIKLLVSGVRHGAGPDRLVHYFESDSSRGRLLTLSMGFSFDGKLLVLNVIGPVQARAAVEQVAVAVRADLTLQ
jgi:hypothetical protein